MKKDIQKKLKNYLKIFPKEKEKFFLLQKQILEEQDILSRKNFEGHVTASGLIISHDKKVLVMFHNTLEKFLQPGGHIEEIDRDIIQSAEREVKEETNLNDIKLHSWCLENNSAIMIDTHKIPENRKKNENEHFHHDFMFIFRAEKTNIILDKNEVSGFFWIDIGEAMKDNSLVAEGLKKAACLNLF